MQVVAGNEAAHAESDDGDWFFFTELFIDIFLESLCEDIEAWASTGWLEFWDVAFDAVGFEPAFQRVEGITVLENTVNQDDAFVAWFGRLRVTRYGGGEYPGEEVEEACGHGLAGRPVELASAEEVDVEMGDGFSSVGAVVHDEPES